MYGAERDRIRALRERAWTREEMCAAAEEIAQRLAALEGAPPCWPPEVRRVGSRAASHQQEQNAMLVGVRDPPTTTLFKEPYITPR